MMKNMNNPTWKTGGMTLMLLCALFTSCSNEELLGEKNPAEGCNTICFGVTHDAEPSTKGCPEAASAAFTANRFVLRSDQSADTLCLRAVVSDGINASPSTTQQSLTRGVPVTGTNDFYDKFRVLAYWKQDNTLMNTFFMNEEASSSAQNVWRTDRIYYWPGSNHALQFYAWAPVDANSFVTPSTPHSTDCTYTVPAAASEQKDILVASTAEISGNNNAAVPLQFEHICSQVRFVVGSEMQPGTIQSVALKNVAGSGTYSMSKKSWTLNAAVTDFSQVLNLSTTGREVDGTGITTPQGTFMMLPQTFAADSPAQVEVVFINEKGVSRTLTASIAGSQWPIGKTITYRLSISPEYELKFAANNPTIADAHYVIIPIKMNASKLCDGNFTLKSTNTEICKLRDQLIGPELQGYWPKETAAQGDFKRTESITSSTESSEVTYYAFLTENATEADRDVHLELQYNNNTITTLTIRQKCPNWMTDGSMGWEYVEEDGEKPFGFAWTRKVTYKSDNLLAGGLISLLRLFGVIESNPAVSFSGLFNVTCTIDYSKVQSLSNVFSDTDGLANTKGFSANSASDLSSLENTLGYLCTISSETGDNINSTDFAALVCIKKNACDVEKQDQGQVVYLPKFTDADIKWYLPARNQFAEGVGLEGQYWSSTAIDDNQNAYSWQGVSQSTHRMENHKVRAVRTKK